MTRFILALSVFLMLFMCACCFSAPQYSDETEMLIPTALPSATPEPTLMPTEEPTQEPSTPPTPTPSPTSEPTPTLTPDPITYARLDSGEFDSFFDDALLIGDSLTDQFYSYILKRRESEAGLLGTVRMVGVKGMNIKTACQDSSSLDRNYIYRGKRVSITELINAYGANRVFIMLGVNDVADRPFDVVAEHFALLIDVIHEKCPGTEVVIQGVLPITRQYCNIQGVTITYFNSFNDVLAEVCEEHGACFLDFSKEMMDEKGYLPLSLSSDQLFHLSKAGEAIWVNALRLYAAHRMYPNAEILLP